MVNSGARNFALGTQRNLVVDHITPHGGNVDLLWDQQNLETLCRHPCHDAVKQQHERNGRDADAWFRLLRQYIEECASAEHVAALANLIPEHVLVEIQ
jgi:5-methylcytosine-specific restriction endonuclease McrA